MRYYIYMFVAQYATEKFAKKLLKGGEIEALQRLDRLTEEARLTVVPSFGVVHGLVGNMRVVMEGARCLHGCSKIFRALAESGSIRRRGVNGYNSTRVGYVSRVEQISTVLTRIRSHYSPGDK